MKIDNNAILSTLKKIEELDAKKALLIKELKAQPAYAKRYIEDAFANIKNVWVIRTDKDGNPYPVTETSKIFRFTDIAINPRYSTTGKVNLKTRNRNATIYSVKMDIQYLNGMKTFISIADISMDRPIKPQLFQSLAIVTAAQLVKIKKLIAEVEADKVNQQKIKDLEVIIKAATAELKKLKLKNNL